jgi:hypothetical protein
MILGMYVTDLIVIKFARSVENICVGGGLCYVETDGLLITGKWCLTQI